jgi:hypothetical protein
MEPAHRKMKDYSKFELYIGNLVLILWIILGAFSCSFFYPLSSIGFFALAAFLVFFELGKHGCQTCYYCKTCTIGMGKLPELFFAKAGTANVNKKAMRLFPFIYLLMSLFPIVLSIISILQSLTAFKIVVLAGLLVFSLFTGIVRRNNLLT